MTIKEPKHTISVLVENRAGVLARIAGLFSARGYNIDSLSVGETEDAAVSRMTIVVKGDENVLEQVQKQLNKLIDVIKVSDYVQTPRIESDLALIKIKAGKSAEAKLKQIAADFQAKVVDASGDTAIVEATGDEAALEDLIGKLQPFGILEMSRTGIVAMARGEKVLSLKDK